MKTSIFGRKRRHNRVRQTVSGTPERPRLNVFRSSKHIYAQIIDDTTGVTLASACTLSPELASFKEKGGNRDAARAVGTLIAQKAQSKQIARVVFDRGGYLYHGRVKELAEAARESGLQF